MNILFHQAFRFSQRRGWGPAWAALLVLSLASGCGRSGDSAGIAATPAEAASQLEQAFASAPSDVRIAAGLASQAMASGDLEKAVVSLQTVRSAETLTLDQGLAVHSSMVVLEGRLASAAGSGDASAKRAYEQLRAMKRK